MTNTHLIRNAYTLAFCCMGVRFCFWLHKKIRALEQPVLPMNTQTTRNVGFKDFEQKHIPLANLHQIISEIEDKIVSMSMLHCPHLLYCTRLRVCYPICVVDSAILVQNTL